MLARPNPSPAPPQEPTHSASGRTVIVKHPGYAWNVDLTLIPTRAGFWVPWLPSALTQRWPFCWWIAVILDHFSRRVIGFAVFKKEPTSEQSCAVFDRAVSRAGYAPKCTISDHGVQFGAAFREWRERNGVKPRFGAIGRYGSNLALATPRLLCARPLKCLSHAVSTLWGSTSAPSKARPHLPVVELRDAA